MFSIRVKTIFEAIFCEEMGDGFYSFLNIFSKTDLWVALGDFTVKNAIWNENLPLTENWVVVYHKYMPHVCAIGFLDLNFN